jgi:tetratricopeptide (TPR) repeat protein
MNASPHADRCSRSCADGGIRPESAFWFRKADALHSAGQLPEALACYWKAIGLQSDLYEAYYNAGRIYHSMNRAMQASRCYRKALELNPDLPQAQNNLGRLYLEAGKTDAAIPCVLAAIRAKPDFAEAHFNLGEALRLRKAAQEAIVAFQRALRLKPSLVGAWNNLGNLLRDQGDPAQAAECFREVVRRRPDLAEGHYNLGSTLKDIGDPHTAIVHLKTALHLNPAHAEGWNNLGLAHKNCGNWKKALSAFSESVRIQADLAAAHWNRASVHLLTGRFREGWEDYEWRFRLPNWKKLYPFRKRLRPWDGKRDGRQRLLVYDEQGLGDTLQFVRYLPLVKERCGQVILETRPELIPLFGRLAGVDEIVARPEGPLEPQAAADACIPLMSLPRVFGTTFETIPAAVPYIRAEAATSEAWKQRLDHPGLKVGLVWAGRPEHQNDRNRSCRLELFSSLTEIPGLRIFSLQKGPAEKELQDSQLKNRIVHVGADLANFVDTAAVVSHLDLLVSVDTSVAHLAGAMARPVWVLIPAIPDWRWMLERHDSPWYPTMRLFRQAREGEWRPVVERIAAELRVRVRERNLEPFHRMHPA